MDSLVTIIVATFNSAPFIAETLESVANQSWKVLELIITDDCSTDNTVALCQEWVKANEKRFNTVKIITTEINTGVPANLNRGLLHAKGEWLSLLAGDDALKPNCIEDNMDWIHKHHDIRVLFSKIEVYKDTFKPHNRLVTIPGDISNPKGIMAQGRNADSQYRMLLLSDRIHYTPSLFIHKEVLNSVGGFDERFRMLEDYPLWLNLTKNGIRLYFMDKITVNYRRHSQAINNTGIRYLINPNYFKQEAFRKIYTYPFLPPDIRLSQRFTWYATQLFRFGSLNKDSKLNRFLLSFLTLYINPFAYIIWFRKRINRKTINNEFYM
jgi:GT2 family glycosyltransferase